MGHIKYIGEFFVDRKQNFNYSSKKLKQKEILRISPLI